MDTIKGIGGTMATVLGVAVSFTDHLEVWLRIIAIFVSIVVGCATAWSIYQNNKRKDLILKYKIDQIKDEESTTI